MRLGGLTDTPQGFTLQCEGHDVRYRNAWIKELDPKEAETGFREQHTDVCVDIRSLSSSNIVKIDFASPDQ